MLPTIVKQRLSKIFFFLKILIMYSKGCFYCDTTLTLFISSNRLSLANCFKHCGVQTVLSFSYNASNNNGIFDASFKVSLYLKMDNFQQVFRIVPSSNILTYCGLRIRTLNQYYHIPPCSYGLLLRHLEYF